MSAGAFGEIATRGFTATAAHDGDALRVRCAGTGDLAVVEALGAFLARIHAEAVRLGVARVVVDLRALDFMNSSCFKAFVTLVSSASALPEGRRYKIELLSNPEHHWQRRSLHALRSLAVDLVSIST